MQRCSNCFCTYGLIIASYIIASYCHASEEPLNIANNNIANNMKDCYQVVVEAYKAANIPITIQLFPAIRALNNANEGISDGFLYAVPELNKRFINLIQVPDPVCTASAHAVTHIDSTAINSSEALSGKTIVAVRGVSWIKHLNPKVHIQFIDTTEQALEMVQLKRADSLVGESNSLFEALTNTSHKTLHISTEPLASTPIYHYVHKKHHDKVELISHHIKNITDARALKDSPPYSI